MIVKDEGANEQIVMDLGDAYKKKCMELCVNACNAGIGWVHYWKGPDSEFHWGVVPSEEVIPVWSSDLDHSLVAVCELTRILTKMATCGTCTKSGMTGSARPIGKGMMKDWTV